jgi:Short C-terminal domain
MPFMRRRPLLRAAAVGGGAYALGKHRVRAEEEQQNQAYAAGQQSMAYSAPAAPVAAAPAAAGGITDSDVARLAELGKLHDQGILTDEEFSRQKALILG